MTEADDAVANSITFEAKKDKCAQLQSGGWTLTLKIHPQDVNRDLMLAVPGQRYMCVLVALGDDERPLKGEDTVPAKAAEKSKRKWEDTPASQQAGILCADEKFQAWITERHGDGLSPRTREEANNHAKNCIYIEFGITSRSELGKSINAEQWNCLVSEYHDAVRETAEIR